MNLIGNCLVARPSITDPFFEKSVVFVFEQNNQHTTGIIINKQANFNAGRLLQTMGYELPLGADPVYRGGPVRDKSITMLHSNDWQSTSTIEVTPKFSLTSDDLMLRRFAAGDVPNGYKFCTGVSIWHNQQLASEVQNGHWLMVDLTKHYVFDYDGLTQWDLSIETAAKHTMDRYFA